jgi:hypothetical protein
MKHIKLYFIITGIFLFSNSIAQEGQRPGFLDKIFVGGGFGASFGKYTYINVSPIIGYRLTPRLSTGIRLMYQYTTFDYFDYQDQRTKKYNGNDFGIGAFARFMIYGPIYLQAEYEHLNYDGLSYSGNRSRDNFDSFMAGGGLAQPIGGKAFLFVTAMYNFSYDNFNSTNLYRVPYNSPWVFRVGITAGF